MPNTRVSVTYDCTRYVSNSASNEARTDHTPLMPSSSTTAYHARAATGHPFPTYTYTYTDTDTQKQRYLLLHTNAAADDAKGGVFESATAGNQLRHTGAGKLSSD